MSELPDDLAELEHRLAARPRPQPNAALRQRVLGAVRNELPRQTNGRWRFAAELAAAVLLGAYLSMSAALNSDSRHSSRDESEITAAAKRLQQLDPDMTEPEARRQVLMLQARTYLAPVQAAKPSLHRLLREREFLRRELP